MNTFINYLIESCIGLCVFLLLYQLLKSETDFKLKRILLLSGIIGSVLFPLIHFNSLNSGIPSLTDLIPSYLLPQITITAEGATRPIENTITIWSTLIAVYLIGAFVFLFIFVFRIIKIVQLIHSSETYSSGKYIIGESKKSKLTFSFFNFIFIGCAHPISATEKQQILNHEAIHVSQWHSLDILLLNVLGIVFWFNPIILVYKKIFIQLHEFEADARAVENHELNEYCSLLARVALQSADFTIANHFNQSLTLKRIAMMQTMKTKIKTWKIGFFIAFFPALFLFIACQDQVSDLQTVANSAAVSLDLPSDIQTQLDKIKAANPGKEYVVVEPTTEEGKKTLEKIDVSQIASMNVIKSGDRGFVIIERNQQNISFAEKASTDNIYTVVEQMPEYVGGMDALAGHISSNMKYPESARTSGIQGTTFASFIVNKDGSITDVQVMKSLSPECDKEAVRVIQLMPNWVPGKQKGEPVNVRFVLPIKFALG